MELNLGKCEVLYFGRSNVRGKYTVKDKTLSSFDVQLMDFGGPIPHVPESRVVGAGKMLPRWSWKQICF